MEVIVYHRVDWDGYTSAAVAQKCFPNAELFGWSYGDPEPDMSSFDKIILVDLSLSEEWMLQNAEKLVWIDHHEAAINRLQTDPVLANIPGIRRVGIGACALAWEYFFPEQALASKPHFPCHIRLVATADVMDSTKMHASLQHALNYMLAMDEYGPGWDNVTKADVSKKHVLLADWFISHNDRSLAALDYGKDLELRRHIRENDIFDKTLREIRVGKYIVAVVNTGNARPNACIQSHCMCASHDAFICIGEKREDGKYKISVRVPAQSTCNAQSFCSVYGGGGHEKASGCLMTEAEINDILSYKTI